MVKVTKILIYQAERQQSTIGVDSRIGYINVLFICIETTPKKTDTHTRMHARMHTHTDISVNKGRN